MNGDEAARGNARVPVQYHEFRISNEDGPTGPDLERGHNALVRVTECRPPADHAGPPRLSAHETK
ncbi:hypothetical protein [Streptomyces canus]|uniref:hypothetical protein n=1 Tax=Streptomyces canus TaxID=58343 RepID=UPI002E354F9D|nr:hypothetical protein [Streptomyces canus]